MSTYDERFARQYRYEPPSGFPLTSPCSDIVHHLSGPTTCAHTQTSLQKSSLAVGTQESQLLRSLRTRCSTTHTCTRAWTPWSVFQDGSGEPPACLTLEAGRSAPKRAQCSGANQIETLHITRVSAVMPRPRCRYVRRSCTRQPSLRMDTASQVCPRFGNACQQCS